MTDLYVCGDPSLPTPFDDNVHGKCECGQPIMWRPHAPKHMKKVCSDCASMYMSEGRKKGEEVKICATPETIEEVRKYFTKGN